MPSHPPDARPMNSGKAIRRAGKQCGCRFLRKEGGGHILIGELVRQREVQIVFVVAGNEPEHLAWD